MKLLKILVFVLLTVTASAQESRLDSLRAALKLAPNDSVRYILSTHLLLFFDEKNIDSASYYAEYGLVLTKKHLKLDLIASLADMGYVLSVKGKYGESLQYFLEAMTLGEDPKSEKNGFWWPYTIGARWQQGSRGSISTPRFTRLRALSYVHATYANLMEQTQNTEQQIFHLKKCKAIAEEINEMYQAMHAYAQMGKAYLTMNNIDSALNAVLKAESLAMEFGEKKYMSLIHFYLGSIRMAKGDKSLARQNYYDGLTSASRYSNLTSLAYNSLGLSELYLAEHEKDSALHYAKRFQQTFQLLGSTSRLYLNLGTVYEALYHSYKLRDELDSAYKYQGLAMVAKDSINNTRLINLAEFQKLSLQERLRLQDVEKDKVVYENKIRTNSLIAGLAAFLLIALILFRNNRQKQKANKVLETTLTNLKSTQSQLIQSEKMASLGELTVGIAHEIQNPLNFVNNFSEINKELIAELKQEIKKENFAEADSIAVNIEDNEEKIHQHGKRADAIVKGMLQHSRTSSSVKEPTDVNALCEEYLRLAYHGLCAKDKTFKAKIQTDFDSSLQKMDVVPQDIGRAILNLINNAFYAVSEKKKRITAGDVDGTSFDPTVSITTKKLMNSLLISVKDNGNGIPSFIKEKIFQPFFTTKPPGQGTGLGLSLSYDIVKAHGGKLTTETIESEGSTFFIELPLGN